MDKGIQPLYEIAIGLQDYLSLKIADPIDKTVDDYLQQMDKCIMNIITTLKLDCDGHEYIEKNLRQFLPIFKVLIGSIAKERLKKYKNKALVRSVADKIFIKFLKIRKISDYIFKFPAMIFIEFCKGITYFDNESITEISKLVYHRDASCGPSDRDYLNKFQKVSLDTETEQMRKANALRKCYIERSIFNDIYMLFTYQDVGHLLELKHIERLLEEYYPNQNLRIIITEYDNVIYPKNMMLINTSHSNNITIQIIETYTKARDPLSYYVSEVYCYKTITKQKNGKSIVKTFSKIQSFQQEMEWKKDIV